MSYKEKPKERGILVGVLIIALGVMIMTIASAFGIKIERNLLSGPGEIVGAFFIYYIGFSQFQC